MVAKVIHEDEAWERSERYAAPRCRRCQGRGVFYVWMATDSSGYDQTALNLCSCITRKKGFVPKFPKNLGETS